MISFDQQREGGSTVTIVKPEVVHEYNRNRGGVDTVDQLKGNYAMGRKSIKNWPSLAWWLIDMCIVNAYRLFSPPDTQYGVAAGVSHRAHGATGESVPSAAGTQRACTSSKAWQAPSRSLPQAYRSTARLCALQRRSTAQGAQLLQVRPLREVFCALTHVSDSIMKPCNQCVECI